MPGFAISRASTEVPNFSAMAHRVSPWTIVYRRDPPPGSRVQRGTQVPATWAEFQIEAGNDHAAHGDISVEQGNDGGAWIRSTDGRNSAAGFSGDILSWGRVEAYQTRPDGVRALASTVGNWLGGPNQAAIDAQQQRIGTVVYVTGGTGIPDVASNNRRLAVEFD